MLGQGHSAGKCDPSREAWGRDAEHRPAAGTEGDPRPAPAAGPRPLGRRPAPPGRGPARLAARRDRRQIRPRGERVCGAPAFEAPEPNPVRPPPSLRPAPPPHREPGPMPAELRQVGGYLVPGERAASQGPGGGGRGTGLPGRTRFCSTEPPAGGSYCPRSGRARSTPGPGRAGE